MQDLEALAATWTRGALVFIETDGTGRGIIRPAAFVYATPTGFAWVEPSYADPWGTPSPALHFREGPPRPAAGDGFKLVTKDAETVTVVPYGDDDRLLVGEPLEWFAQYMAESGLDWAAERERVRAMINPTP
jgi:hypothetical protein